MIFFQFATEGRLFTPLNLTNLIQQNSYVVVLALGMLLVIVSGHIDLSVGSIAGFVGAVGGALMVWEGVDPWLACLACLVLGAVIGAAQGYFIAYRKIPSFIVTLAGMLAFRGLCMMTLNGERAGPVPSNFQKMSSGFIADLLGSVPDVFSGGTGKIWVTTLLIGLAVPILLVLSSIRGRRNEIRHGVEQEPLLFFLVKTAATLVALAGLGYLLSTYNGLPNILILMGVLVVLYAFVTTRTTIGRRIYAVGGNQKAAKLSGINTERLVFFTFVNMGVLAALAGLITTARLTSATPQAGTQYELDAIAACFIGGASASGGVGKITGVVIGAFIMGVMNNGMSILGLGIDLQMVIKGLVLLAAVAFDVYNKNKG
jgi:putative multiple sugar transport system permease protein